MDPGRVDQVGLVLVLLEKGEILRRAAKVVRVDLVIGRRWEVRAAVVLALVVQEVLVALVPAVHIVGPVVQADQA